MMHRRRFLEITAISGLSLMTPHCSPQTKKLRGGIIGASASTGHLLHQAATEAPARTIRKQVVIVGGGVSGLSAARWLHRQGIRDLLLLDLEDRMGGNAASGSNTTSAFPLGAHYVPTPNNDLEEYLRFLQEAGVITGFENGLPVYNEYHLCFDPQERLYINGRWQEGLIPAFGVPEPEQVQIRRFLEKMDAFRTARGKDGHDAFAIPVDRSSTDERFTALDGTSMRDWLHGEGLDSPHLHWYVDYCTRDDFGTPAALTSAWAGIHYFAARKGKGANAHHSDVLTWPEGTRFLIKAMEKEIGYALSPGCLVRSVRPKAKGVEVLYFHVADKETVRIEAEQCILAVPQFIAGRLLGEPERIGAVRREVHYAPWLVANLQVRPLAERSGAPLSWDNVLYGSSALGYVNATQQLVQSHHSSRNLTYYLPLTGGEPTQERKAAMDRSFEEWSRMIFEDLRKTHPDIEEKTEELTIQLWGHAMAQPRPGWIHGPVRRELSRSLGHSIHFAHTDLAGVSLFEEGFYQGLKAAEKVEQALNGASVNRHSDQHETT